MDSNGEYEPEPNVDYLEEEGTYTVSIKPETDFVNSFDKTTDKIVALYSITTEEGTKQGRSVIDLNNKTVIDQIYDADNNRWIDEE